MQKIVPHLWFEIAADVAVKFYASLFHSSLIVSSPTIGDTPSGSMEIMTIVLLGQGFMLILAGPLYKFTPAVFLSLHATQRKRRADRLRRGSGQIRTSDSL